MPCNSDHMYPTPNELARLSDLEQNLKDVADRMVFNADVMREIILRCTAARHNLTVPDAIALTKLSVGAFQLTVEGESLVDKIKGEYAYKDRGGKSSTINVYNRAKAEHGFAAAVAEAIIEYGEASPADFEKIENAQIAHRMEDVKRLIKTFTDKGDFKMVAKLTQVDFAKPLEPQIGFDPDFS